MAKSRRRRLSRLRTVMVGHGQAQGAVVWELVAPEVLSGLELSSVTELNELSSRSIERLGVSSLRS